MPVVFFIQSEKQEGTAFLLFRLRMMNVSVQGRQKTAAEFSSAAVDFQLASWVQTFTPAMVMAKVNQKIHMTRG